MTPRRRKRARRQRPRRRTHAKAQADAMEAAVMTALADASMKAPPPSHPVNPLDIMAMDDYLAEYLAIGKEIDLHLTALADAMHKGANLEALIHDTARNRLHIRRIPDPEFGPVASKHLADFLRIVSAGGIPLPSNIVQAVAEKLALQIGRSI